MSTSYTGKTHQEAILKAMMHVCKPCCNAGGSASGSISRPCGCSACECCPGICWWQTDWHKHWTTSHGRYATGVVGPTWQMTTYSMTIASWVASTDYIWGGETTATPGSCALGFATKLESNCTLSVLPAVMTGTVVWTRTVAPFDTITQTVSFFLAITIQFGCGDDYVFCLYTGLGVSGDPLQPGSYDYVLSSDSGTDEIGVDTTTCSFTASSPEIIGLPAITIVPVE